MKRTGFALSVAVMGFLAPLGVHAQSTSSDPVLGQTLASEYTTFSLSVATRIAYGVPGKFRTFDLAPGNYVCGNQLEGYDPAVGIAKTCYATPTASTPGGKLAEEFAPFTLTAATRIAYGISGKMRVLDLPAGKYTCGNQLDGDPAVGIAKACYGPTTLPLTSAQAVLGQKLADENNAFVLSASMRVAYGIPGKMRVTQMPAGSNACQNGQGIDPAPGIVKACYGPTTLALSTTAAPIITTPTTPVISPPVVPPVVVPTTPTAPTTPTNPTTPTVGLGNSDPAGYRAVAATFGTDAGIAYRYGTPSSASITTTYSGPRPSKPMNMVSIQNPNGLGSRGCGWTGYCGNYQIGELHYPYGDYSSNAMSIAYIPDAAPGANWPAPKYWGLGNLQQLNVAHDTISITPEVSWTRYDGAVLDGGANDRNTYDFTIGDNPWGVIPINGKPIATTRGYGRGGWTNNNLTVWSDGWVTSSGSNTSHNYLAIKLPTTNMSPTAIAISNSGEFAFVTAWDTANLKGKVAVIALSDGCQNCYMANEGTPTWERNWGTGKKAYPGFPGLGNYNGGKFIGWLDLPSDMTAPTEVAVTTGKEEWKYQSIQNFWDDDIQVEANRKRQYNGDLAQAFPRTGVLAVISKGEKKAAFFDLRPLFAYYREQYLNQPQAQWTAMIANRGNNASQWPYTFDNTPAQKPKLIKTMVLDDEPTAVRLTTFAPFRALIGTKGGTLRVLDLGPNYLEQNAALTGSPSDIVELFQVQAGANVTSIAHVKQKGSQAVDGVRLLYGYASDDDFMWTLSRGEKKAVLWQFNKARTVMTAFRTLQDSHMTDPIALEDGDNHGTESYVLSILDYTGKAVHNYTYGGIRTWTEASYPCPTATSCLPANGAQFEYFGKYVLPGKPFQLGSANIN